MDEFFKFTCGEHGELEGFEVTCKRCSNRYMDKQKADLASLTARLAASEAALKTERDGREAERNGYTAALDFAHVERDVAVERAEKAEFEKLAIGEMLETDRAQHAKEIERYVAAIRTAARGQYDERLETERDTARSRAEKAEEECKRLMELLLRRDSNCEKCSNEREWAAEARR